MTMKKTYLLFSVMLCLLTITGTVFATNYGKEPVHVKKVKPLVTKLKVPYTVSFNFTNDLPNGLSYLFNSGSTSIGGVVNAESYAIINLPAGTYNVNIVPTNGPGNPVRANFLFNNGVAWNGDPGHNFTGVVIGTGSGQASALTATVH